MTGPDGLGESGVVDALLHELTQTPSAKRIAHICVELGEERLLHQGQWSAAALPAVPRLLALLQTSEAKEFILLVLARIAAGHPEPHWHGYLGGDEALRALDARGDAISECRRCIADARDVISAQLESKRGVVRAAAALVLALFAPDAATSAAVAARFKKEKDEKARGALYLCVSSWQRAFDVKVDAALVKTAEAKPFTELCRAAACAWDAAARELGSRDVLVAGFGDPPKGFDAQKDLPISSKQIAFAALLAAYPEAAREVGIEGVRKEAIWPRDLAAMFLRIPPAQDAWADLPLFSELPEADRVFLHALIEATPVKSKGGDWLTHQQAKATGFPSHTPDARRWAGIDPPAVWELPLAGVVAGGRVVWPVARWYRRLALGKLPREALFEALRLHPDPAEAVSIAMKGNTGHVYDLFYLGSAWTWVESVIFAIDVLGARKDSEAALLAQLAVVEHGWEPLIVVTALARVMAPRTLPEAVDVLFPKLCDSFPPLVPHMREALNALPVARRDAIILALPLPAPLSGGSRLWNVIVTARPLAWAFLDMVSDRAAAAQKLAQSVAQWPPSPAYAHQGRLPEAEALAAFTALGSHARAAIEAALPAATPDGKAFLARVLASC